MYKNLILTFIIMCALVSLNASFTETGNFTSLGHSSAVWADIDQDGDLDLIISGENQSQTITEVYQNNSGSLVSTNNLSPMSYGCLDVGDFNNDNNIDMLSVGYDRTIGAIAYLFKNNNGSFIQENNSLSGAYECSINFIDFDNDGDQDIFITGDNDTYEIAKLYKNTNGVYTEISTDLPPCRYCASAWADYDHDGFIELAISGSFDNAPITKLYKYMDNQFTEINTNLPAVWVGTLNWGDYDNDGDLDLLLSGNSTSNTINPQLITKIYNNNNGILSEADIQLPGVWFSSCNWVDYDNDGDLDIFISGIDSILDSPNAISKLYINNNSVFNQSDDSFVGVYHGNSTWGDYDNDGDLDLLLIGNTTSTSTSTTVLYKNDNNIVNTPPTQPNNLTCRITAGNLCVSWQNGTDTETPITGLTYNLRIGTTSGACDVLSPMASSNGSHFVTTIGNCGYNNSYTMHVSDTLAVYYCSVQTIDGANKGSTFTEEINSGNGIVRVATPTFSIPTGYSSVDPFTVSLNCSTTDAEIRYTIDGTTPSPESTIYSEPINIIGYTVIKVIAFREGFYPSLIATAQYDNFPFECVDTGLMQLGKSACAWLDYDNDNDLDLLMTGADSLNCAHGILYNNNNGVFTVGNYVQEIAYGSVACGDVNNDNKADIALVGWPNGSSHSFILSSNDANQYSVYQQFTGAYESTTSFLDFNNDGKQDLLYSGDDDLYEVTKLLVNQDSLLTFSDASLQNLRYSCAAIGDYDNDGDQDIIICGENGEAYTLLYQNNNGVYSLVAHPFENIWAGSVNWVDIDNDGDLDLFMTGRIDHTNNPVSIAKIYCNVSGAFSELDTNIQGTWFSSSSWADYDNDGDMDLLISGCTGPISNVSCITKLYTNNNGIFAQDTSTVFPGVWHGSTIWGDYDNDGDTDIILTGNT